MDVEQVKKLAALARINVSEVELESFTADMGKIIGFVDRVRNVTLDAVPNTTGSEINIFRADEVQPLASMYDLVECAPDHAHHFVKVPKVIE